MDLAEQRRICAALEDRLRIAQKLALPMDIPRLAHLRELAEGMENYLRYSQDMMDEMCDEFERTGKKISDMIDDAIRQINRRP